jgi:hypothetical protein
MASTLGTSIIDRLVPVIDRIRGTIHPKAGDRQWNVAVVRRVWPSGRRGDASGGAPVSTVLQLTPQPRVEFPTDEHGVHFEMQPHGKLEEGTCKISEISLTYSEDQLTPQNLPANTEFYFRLTDAQGQLVPARHYVPAGPASPDREKNMGWTITLTRRTVNE